MIYATYKAIVQPDKMAEYYKLQTAFVEFAAKYKGVKILGAWRTLVGDRQEVTMLEAYESMNAFEEFRALVGSDPKYKAVGEALNKIRTVSCKLLEATPYSPMK